MYMYFIRSCTSSAAKLTGKRTSWKWTTKRGLNEFFGRTRRKVVFVDYDEAYTTGEVLSGGGNGTGTGE